MARKASPLVCLLASACALLFAAPSAFAAPPANDNFANAQVVGPALPVSVAGTTTEATFESGEPDHLDSGDPTGMQSVWYSWTPTTNTSASVNVCDPDAPGVAVYTGTTLATLTLVAGGEGDCTATFAATSGQTYRIAVADFADSDFTLEIKQGGVIISNGTVQLGVRPEGHLNAPGGTPSNETGTETVGIRYVPTNHDSVSPGCECEGWGAGDATSMISGFANESTDGGANNMTVQSFTSDADEATSVVNIGTTLQVTHAYDPVVGQPNLYQAVVTIQNISAGNVDPRYRRVMDWDIEPTAFDDWVTVGTGASTRLLDNDNDGFATADPLGPDGDIDPMFTGSFIDEGPYDHGSRFDFGFPTLMPTQSVTFTIYYGAAGNETDALNALNAVNTEVFSIGEPNTPDGPSLGTPNTFVFGFTGVGGGDAIGSAPNTSITSGPSGATSSPNPSFTYAGDPPGDTAGFVCSLSGPMPDPSASCPNGGKSYTGLPDGSYTFRVSAVDADGNTDPSPAARTFIIDTTPPPSPPVGTGLAPPPAGAAPGPTGRRAAALKKCKKKTGKARVNCRKKAKKLPV
jgi:hypothetical protein